MDCNLIVSANIQATSYMMLDTLSYASSSCLLNTVCQNNVSGRLVLGWRNVCVSEGYIVVTTTGGDMEKERRDMSSCH